MPHLMYFLSNALVTTPPISIINTYLHKSNKKQIFKNKVIFFD